MRILVAAAFEASSQRAHVINTVKMAQGFAGLGHRVTIVCKRPAEGKVRPTELSAAYGLRESIEWIQVPSKVLGRPIGRYWDFGLLSFGAVLKKRPDVIYTRNYILPYLTSLFGIKTVAETHAHPDNRTKPFLRLLRGTSHREFRLLVTISDRLAEAYRSLGATAEKIIVLPDGADTQLFLRPDRLPATPYPNQRPVIAYTGHLYDYKGIPTVLEASAMLPEAQFHFIGGFPEDIARQKEKARSLGVHNVHFHGMKPHGELPPYLWHADVLLLPPSAEHPSARWTSPLKLGEYLASGTPVVATSVPALQDWLTDKEVKFVPPDDAGALAEGIRAVLEDRYYSRSLSRGALSKSSSFSVVDRVQKILDGATRLSRE